MERERARYKLYNNGLLAKLLDPNYNLYTPMSHRGNRFMTLSNYSHPALVSSLNKTNKAKLYAMMAEDFPLDTFVEGTGFKTPYRYPSDDDKFVYVIDGVLKNTQKEADPERETLLVRRYNPDRFHKFIKNFWSPINGGQWEISPMDVQVKTYMRNNADEVKGVYKDRLSKAERTKLSLLYLVEPETYVEGIGGVWFKRVWDYNANDGRGGWRPNERVYFLEEPKRNEVVS